MWRFLISDHFVICHSEKKSERMRKHSEQEQNIMKDKTSFPKLTDVKNLKEGQKV